MQNQLKNSNPRIAIIGAGASGLTAAYYLKKLGYRRVTVFERESYVGGKVLSYENEGKIHELGAIIIGNKKNYKTYHELLEAYDIPLEHFETPDIVFLDRRRCSFEQYLKNNYPLARSLEACLRMLQLGIKFRKYLRNGFIDGNRELFINFAYFVRRHKIEPLADTLCPFLIGCGYGCYEEIPSIYLFRFLWWFFRSCLRFEQVLKILSQAETSEITSCKNGCQELWIKMAEELQVETNVKIESIRRNRKDFAYGKNPKIEIIINGHGRTYDRLIISSPLDETIQFIDVSEEEKDLFSKIEYSDYYVTLFKGEGFAKTVFVRDYVYPEAKGRTVAICCRHKNSNVYTGYQIAPPNINSKELIEILKKDVRQLGGRFIDVIKQKHWRYFPRVGLEDLNAGFYKRLNELQGQGGTYYIGAVMNFETLENTVDFAKELVLKHFGNK